MNIFIEFTLTYNVTCRVWIGFCVSNYLIRFYNNICCRYPFYTTSATSSTVSEIKFTEAPLLNQVCRAGVSSEASIHLTQSRCSLFALQGKIDIINMINYCAQYHKGPK